jgi:hypothetical protein
MSNQKPLVLRHLEDVSWRVLEEYPEVIKTMIRRQAGIYVLYRRDKLYYVGLASNLMGRLKSHLKDRHHGLWDRFSVYLTIDDEHMKELESLLLRIVEPSGNRTGGKFAKSQNLVPVLNHAMSESDANKRARLLGGKVAQRRMRNTSRRGTGTLQLAGIVERPIVLQAHYNGQRLRAVLRRDGQIKYAQKLYESPSGAARAATGASVNGWNFWHYRNKSKWIPLSNIKK